ncbi:hypothetical protein H2201_000791 [Coniosporium apollinis]|uniref:SMP domain-containing protein n=2 Tax=Coniosporium TaxID=2810619 RepID=A0ABQ9P5R1_9PEZI|nr:hypothetical protein H2199_001311 [Cladosporium sp. JES 115]KAJ9668965.1 hypothetical protein H2201_000791 [Coniosporium apollinis]
MSTDSGITPQDISETARAEGGTTKGSLSAQMQSQYTKELNANGGASEDQGTTGTASNNTSSVNTTSDITPAEQSRLDRERNLQEALDVVQPKMAYDPKSVTQEDASLLESREQRAHGVIPKGSVTATARSLADKNAAYGGTGTTT